MSSFEKYPAGVYLRDLRVGEAFRPNAKSGFTTA